MNKQILRNTIFIGLFLVPFVPLLVSSSFFFPFITTKAFAWRIIVEIVFAAWVLLALSDPQYRPRRSIILYAVLSFLIVIGVADLFGIAPLKSFWSNFERMEGFISLIHLGMFFVVIASFFKEVDWKKWWNVSLAVSFLMVLYSTLQLLGLKTINQGGVRVDGTLGNAIYLAVYMLFHVFIALLFLWREWKNTALRWVYGLLILTQVIVLYYTATRGAILGLVGGVLIMAILNIFNKENKAVRKASLVILVGLVILISSFITFRNSEFVSNSPVLSRFSSLTTAELKTQGRFFVWPMAYEGVKERPLLGWGQENFSFIFQEHYRPEMFRLEPWFDRAHNIFLDWAVAGGLLGLLAYLSLYVTLLYLIWKQDNNLPYAERSVLTGLIAAYFFHNFFVFDHLISYILFFSLLAYIHFRNSGELSLSENETNIQKVYLALPVVAVLLISALYLVNVKPIIANTSLIRAFKFMQTPGEGVEAMKYFQKAHQTSRLGRPETVEQIVSNLSSIFNNDVSLEEKTDFYNFTKDAVAIPREGKRDDARHQLMVGSFFSSLGMFDEALIYLERARELIPGKQQIYFEIGSVYINGGDRLKALETFKEAYDLAPENKEATVIYLIGAIYAGDRALEDILIAELPEGIIAQDGRIRSVYTAVGR